MASAEEQKFFRIFKSKPENNNCFECGTQNPDWASIPLGIIICRECAGRHRGLGVHLSFVRSVTMDTWTDVQLASMRVGGNSSCREYFEKFGIYSNPNMSQKYGSPAAQSYRDKIKTLINGGEWKDPTSEELAKKYKAMAGNYSSGFGPSMASHQPQDFSTAEDDALEDFLSGGKPKRQAAKPQSTATSPRNGLNTSGGTTRNGPGSGPNVSAKAPKPDYSDLPGPRTPANSAPAPRGQAGYQSSGPIRDQAPPPRGGHGPPRGKGGPRGGPGVRHQESIPLAEFNKAMEAQKAEYQKEIEILKESLREAVEQNRKYAEEIALLKLKDQNPATTSQEHSEKADYDNFLNESSVADTKDDDEDFGDDD